MPQQEQAWKSNQVLIFLSTISIFIVILKFAADLLVPFLIAIVLNPIFSYLEKKYIPKVVSMVLMIVIFLIPIAMLTDNIAVEVKSLTYNFHSISQKFTHSVEQYISSLHVYGIAIDQDIINKIIEKSNLSSIIQKLASQTSSQFSNIFLIFFTAAFMLMESDFLYNKMIKIAKENNKDIDEWMHILTKIKSYFLIKVKTSLLTALWALGVLWYFDVSYSYLWVTLVFFLNFVPVIGSIMAAIPAIVMAGIDHGGMVALWVALWYLLINITVGNVLEPKIMGKGLGLSALVIFISMTFWGWVFGPAGMILSVPLTMVVQFMFEQCDETRWISLLLSDYKKEEQ
jgi:predicted PurR-regulated permease PerM